jgi:hypothetical protein
MPKTSQSAAATKGWATKFDTWSQVGISRMSAAETCPASLNCLVRLGNVDGDTIYSR